MSRIFRTDKLPPPRAVIPALPKKVDLEIGCGVGMHAIRYSMENSDRYLVAIERTSGKFAKFYRRFQNHGHPKNLLPVHDDAEVWCGHYLKEVEIGRLFLLYPNPEPKRANQRWSHTPFADYIISKLAPRGEIVFATNIPEYAEELKSEWTKRKDLSLVSEEILGSTSVARTHFEKKYLARGEVCFNLLFAKQL